MAKVTIASVKHMMSHKLALYKSKNAYLYANKFIYDERKRVLNHFQSKKETYVSEIDFIRSTVNRVD